METKHIIGDSIGPTMGKDPFLHSLLAARNKIRCVSYSGGSKECKVYLCVEGFMLGGPPPPCNSSMLGLLESPDIITIITCHYYWV